MLSALTSVGIFPTHWVASVWKTTPLRSWQSVPISGISLIVPISLFAHMIGDEDRVVAQRVLDHRSRVIESIGVRARARVTSKPFLLHALDRVEDGLVLVDGR